MMKTPLFNLHDLVLLLTLSACVLLAVFEFFLPRRKSFASTFLSLFFLCVGLTALCNLLLWNEFIHIEQHWIKTIIPYLLALALLGKGASLLMYTQAITQQQFRVKKPLIYHTGLLLVVAVYMAVDHMDSDDLRFIAKDQTDASMGRVVFLWSSLKLLPIIYGLAAALVAFYYKAQLKQYYSSLSMQGPWWLNILIAGFVINWSWSLAVHWFADRLPITTADLLGIGDNYITFVLVNALFIYSIVYARQLMLLKSKTRETTQPSESPPHIAEQIRAGMEMEKLYLQQTLNIEEFSKRIGLPYRQVSQVINMQFNTNFFDFVNQYRINTAKAMLTDPRYAQLSILDILLESGFNSKSAFNRFFKRYTGMSAADFSQAASGREINAGAIKAGEAQRPLG